MTQDPTSTPPSPTPPPEKNDAASERRKKRKRMPWILGSAAVFVAILLFGYQHRQSENKASEKLKNEAETASGKKKEEAQEKPKVKVYKVSRQNFVHNMETLGTMLSTNQVDLRFEVSGTLSTLAFKEGEQVSEGDTVAELSHGDSELKVEFRRSKLKEAEFEQNSWQAKFDTAQKLLEAGAINQSGFAETESNFNRSLQAVKSAKIEMQSAEAELEKTYLKSPLDGIVGKVEIKRGEYVSPQNKIMSLLEIKEVICEFSVLEQNIPEVSDDMKISLTVAPYPEEEFKGKIESLGTTIETTEGRARKVKALVQNKGHKLMPGMFAHVKIILYQKDNALTIPTTAFPGPEDLSKVWVIGENDVVTAREVSVEHMSHDDALIEKGIAEGDQVVLEVPTLKLKEGLTVEIVEVLEGKKASGA